MRIMLLILAPYVLLAFAAFYSLRAALRSRSPGRILFLPAILISALLTATLIGWGVHGIENSSSSTAAIGYLVLPYLALAAAAIFFLLALAGGVIVRWILERTGRTSRQMISTPRLLCAILFLGIAGWLLHQNITRSRRLDAAEAETTPQAVLQTMLTDAMDNQDVELQSRLARNPALPAGDLILLFDGVREELQDPSSNHYSIFSSLARNPRTPPDILARLATSTFSSVRIEVILNPSTPAEALAGLVNDEDDLVRSCLSDCPRLPPEIKKQLKKH